MGTANHANICNANISENRIAKTNEAAWRIDVPYNLARNYSRFPCALLSRILAYTN
jgi:hypothetical protein